MRSNESCPWEEIKLCAPRRVADEVRYQGQRRGLAGSGHVLAVVLPEIYRQPWNRAAAASMGWPGRDPTNHWLNETLSISARFCVSYRSADSRADSLRQQRSVPRL